MKEFSSPSESNGHRAAEQIHSPMKPSEVPQFERPSLDRLSTGGANGIRSRRAEGRWGGTTPELAMPGMQEETTVRLPPAVSGLQPPSEGKRTRETVTRDAELAREKFSGAIGDYLATVIGDPLFMTATNSWETESDLVSETIDALEAVSGWLQAAVDTPLRGVSAALGLSAGEAALTAGVSANLILSPITGPLDKAESYIGIGGVVFGLMTGGHGLVLACVKPLLHGQIHHLLARGFVKALGDSRTDRPRSATHGTVQRSVRPSSDALRSAPSQASIQPMLHHPEQHNELFRPAQFPVPQNAPETRHQPTPREPLWLCLAFAPKPPTRSGTAHTAAIRTAAERDMTNPIVLPMGDDAFLRTLPAVLRHGSLTQVDMTTARTLRDPGQGQHFILKMEDVGFGKSNIRRGSHAVHQHPGCLTGRCAPLGGPRCPCLCSVCRSDR